jgi:hypothetical protein
MISLAKRQKLERDDKQVVDLEDLNKNKVLLFFTSNKVYILSYVFSDYDSIIFVQYL